MAQAKLSCADSQAMGDVWTCVVFARCGPGEIIISGLTAGTYSNINLTANGCSFPITAPVILQDPNLPVVNVNPVIKCDLQTDAITATPVIPGNYTYNWTVPTGETPPGNIPSFNPTVSGPHSVIITDTTTNCSSISSSGNVTINPNITPTFSPIAPFTRPIEVFFSLVGNPFLDSYKSPLRIISSASNLR
jgi:hypothetical protein